jgi:hypothetical protein
MALAHAVAHTSDIQGFRLNPIRTFAVPGHREEMRA